MSLKVFYVGFYDLYISDCNTIIIITAALAESGVVTVWRLIQVSKFYVEC